MMKMNPFPIPFPTAVSNNSYDVFYDLQELKKKVYELENRIHSLEEKKEDNYLKKEDQYHMI